jgi:hypothetical protein
MLMEGCGYTFRVTTFDPDATLNFLFSARIRQLEFRF